MELMKQSQFIDQKNQRVNHIIELNVLPPAQTTSKN